MDALIQMLLIMILRQLTTMDLVVTLVMTDQTALNYNSNMCYDDGSCTFPVYGCTDPNANNYNPQQMTMEPVVMEMF